MALAYNPFTEAGRDRRLTDPRPYSQFAGGVINPNVANPTPVREPVASLPNQLNVDENQAYPIYEDFAEGYIDRLDAGLGFVPLPTPMLTATSERDPTNADYLSRGYEGDWSGVQPWLRPMQELFLEPVVGRQNASIEALNAERERVRQVTQPVSYGTERAVQNVNPQTGQSYTTFTPTTKIQPFFPVDALYI